MTRASTPGSLSTSTAMVCFSTVSLMVTACPGRSDEHHALFGNRAGSLLVRGPQQHLIMRRARGDHREAVFRRIDRDIGDDRLVGGQHLLDDAIDVAWLLGAQPYGAEGFSQFDEIGQRRGVAFAVTA